MRNMLLKNVTIYAVYAVLMLLIVSAVSGCRKKGKISGSGATVTLLGSIEVTPNAPVLEIGEEIDLTAIALENSDNNVAIDQSAIVFTWQACSEDLAVVKTDGPVANVRAKSPGTCVVSVATESFGSLEVSVVINEPKVVGIRIAPLDTIGQVGGTVDFTAFAEYSDKSSQDITDQVVWSSKPSTATTFSSSHPGRARAVVPGKSKVVATYSGFSGEATLDVADAQLARMLIVSEAKPYLQGVTQQFRNIGIYDDGSTVDLTPLSSWTVSNAQVASVSNSDQKGLAVLLQSGNCKVSATYGSLSASANFTVGTAILTGISMSPVSFPIAAGYSQNLSLTGTYSDGTILDLTSAAQWSSENSTFAEVSNSIPTKGLLNGLSVGNVRINATVLGLTAHSRISVTSATINALTVNPSALTIPVGSSRRLQLGGSFSDSSHLDVTAKADWQSSNANVTVNNSSANKGLVKAEIPGSAEVSATIAQHSAISTVEVIAASLKSIAITPSPVQLAPLSQQKLSAIATFDDLSTHDFTELVEWNSSDNSKAIVLNSDGVKGRVIAVASGNVDITATFEDKSVSVAVSISSDSMPVISSIAVIPSPASISANTSLQFTATGFYSDGSTQNLTNSVVWSSASSNVATINATTGLLAGLSGGQTIVTASKDGLSSNAQVTVTVDQLAPPSPTGLTAGNPTSNSLELSWNSGGGTTASFKYAYQSGGSAPSDCASGTVGTTENTTVVLNNLSPSTQYSAIVCAINSDSMPDESAASTPASGTTLVAPPAAFTMIGATNGDTQSVVSWNGSAGAATYTLKYGTSPGNYTATVSTNAVSPVTVTGLSNGANYYFMVVAVNPGGSRNATAEVMATPAAPPPSAPTNVVATTISTVQIDLSWDNMPNDGGGYKIAYLSGASAPASCNTGVTTTAAADATTKSISGLTPGTQYTFTICTSSSLSGDSLPASGVSKFTRPVAPTISAAANSSSEITLTWAAVTGDTGGYKIAYKSGPVAPVGCDSDLTTTALPGATSKVISSLAASTQYTFIACTVNTDSGQSAVSSSVADTTASSGSSQTFTSGSGNFSVPLGVTSIVVEVWGAGGGGGSGKDGGTQGGAAGGGGGAYCKETLTVTPSEAIPYVVGAGGTGAVDPGNNIPGENGGASTVTYAAVVYTSNGGTGGASDGNLPVGTGGTASNCDETRTGGNASENVSSSGGGGGSSAATGNNGTSAVATVSGATAPAGGGSGGNGGANESSGFGGALPGGGGGGGAKRGSGGNGANGTVKFSW